jgi:hypothetical protein
MHFHHYNIANSCGLVFIVAWTFTHVYLYPMLEFDPPPKPVVSALCICTWIRTNAEFSHHTSRTAVWTMIPNKSVPRALDPN